MLGTEASKFTSFSCCVYQAAEDTWLLQMFARLLQLFTAADC